MTIEKDLLMMSICVFLPSLFALAVLFVPKGKEEIMRWISLVGTAATFIVSTFIFVDYWSYLGQNPDQALSKTGEMRADAVKTSLAGRAEKAEKNRNEPANPDDLLARYPWIGRFNIEYFLGVDGISMAMILLTTVLFFLSMIASWGIEKHVKGYCMLFLILETGVLGTFFALDFFLFYIFWEVMLLPMYFLIGIWGGPRREYAAIKFFLYTLFGSVFILIAMLGFYFTDVQDFAYKSSVEIAKEKALAEHPEWEKQAKINQAFEKSGKGLQKKGAKTPVKLTPTDLDANKKAMSELEVHTFDLIVLAKAGKAAMHWIALADDSAGRDAFVKQIVERRKTDGIETSAKSVEGRLNQMLFANQTFQIVMFLFLFVGFAIKVPVFPFHTWLPDAHVEAPTPISMILAGILLKLGGYGILRICYPVCPWAAQYLAWYLCVVAMINIIYGAFAAMAQTDFKKLVAYSSISHMGYVILGIAVWQNATSQYWAWGMNGAMYQMIAHGISSAGMFFCVGVIYDRAHHRNLDNFRGLNEPMPLYGGISAVIFFAALGLPGLCGFVGEFFVVLSTWSFSTPDYPNAGKVFAVLSALTVVITAAYILWTLQRVYLGTNPAYKDYKDITLRELACIIPLVVLAIVLGILPMLVLQWMEPSVTGLVDGLVQATM